MCYVGRRRHTAVLVGKPGGRRSLVRIRCGRENNIKSNLREICGGDVDLNNLLGDRDQLRTLLNTVVKLQVPQNVENFLSV
jgi:hypothetical protein